MSSRARRREELGAGKPLMKKNRAEARSEFIAPTGFEPVLPP